MFVCILMIEQKIPRTCDFKQTLMNTLEKTNPIQFKLKRNNSLGIEKNSIEVMLRAFYNPFAKCSFTNILFKHFFFFLSARSITKLHQYKLNALNFFILSRSVHQEFFARPRFSHRQP